jgi:hypothetical protein
MVRGGSSPLGRTVESPAQRGFFLSAPIPVPSGKDEAASPNEGLGDEVIESRGLVEPTTTVRRRRRCPDLSAGVGVASSGQHAVERAEPEAELMHRDTERRAESDRALAATKREYVLVL